MTKSMEKVKAYASGYYAAYKYFLMCLYRADTTREAMSDMSQEVEEVLKNCEGDNGE